ncbi:septation protein IspZ [Pseudomonas sp.]|uniref:septation protein IspZ n=1 Tax=Pseudomonas sp. TaxID=306 RepID=UPI0028A884BE|nr:septation protein IspZ [Pseudomonas sp.]
MTERDTHKSAHATVDVTPASSRELWSGIHLSASLLWRIFVLQIALSIPLVLLFASSGVSSTPTFVLLKPSIVYLFICVVLASSLLFIRKGLFYLVWGERMKVAPSFFKRFTWALCALYLVLGLANFCVAFLAPVDVWINYKLFIPFPCIVLFCLLAPRFICDA